MTFSGPGAIAARYDELLAATLEACRDAYGDRLVALAVFGSVGRRTMRPDSDIDLLLVIDLLPDRRLARMEEFAAVEHGLSAPLREAREAQEIVELALKGMLRAVGVEPPHWHDVGGMLQEHRDRLASVDAQIDRLAATSAWLRKEREFAFYGEIDLIPRIAIPRPTRARHSLLSVTAGRCGLDRTGHAGPATSARASVPRRSRCEGGNVRPTLAHASAHLRHHAGRQRRARAAARPIDPAQSRRA